MSDNFTAIEPAQAHGYFLPKPGIVIQIAFHQLLHVVVSVAVIFRGDAG